MILCLLLSCLSFGACTRSPEKFSEYSFDYFDTVTTITGYAKDREEFDRVADDIIQELSEYHRLFTIYHRFEGMENLCTVNELVDGAHRTVKVDRRIIDLLLYAKDMYALTHGQCNVAMGSVLSVWHDYRTEGMDDPAAAKLPPMDKLREAVVGKTAPASAKSAAKTAAKTAAKAAAKNMAALRKPAGRR
jgi:thiamine biosynthesis lipoprotein